MQTIFSGLRRSWVLSGTLLTASGLLLSASGLLLSSPLALAQSTAPSRPMEPATDARQTSEPALKKPDAPVPAETKVETQHDWTVGSRPVHYTATAGTMLIRDEENKPYGSIFYVAYTENKAPASGRPVTFFYNGGPGSATIWLHMGSLGPVRVLTASPEATGPAPFRYVPNEYSLLDKSDLVFIDAPLTGFSRAAGKATAKDFAGTDQDVAAFEKFIIRYLTVNQRWDSPKFLFGESYGTTRSGALVAALNNDGVQFNGITLLSSILNYSIRNPGYDVESYGYLPSYAAVAYYAKKVPQTGTLAAWVEQARQFAIGPYAHALAQAGRLSPAETDEIANKVASFTGLSAQFVKDSNLRVSPTRFRKELLRSGNEILGRYDARFEGYDIDAAGEAPGYDPSDTGISGVYVGAFHSYLQTELKYVTDDTYDLQGPGIFTNWDFKHHASGEAPGSARVQSVPDVAVDLGDAMRKNPHLKVFSANGYFDLATPFFITEYDLAHMNLPPALRGNVEFGYYPAGHMVYLNVEALRMLRADMDRFYTEATSR